MSTKRTALAIMAGIVSMLALTACGDETSPEAGGTSPDVTTTDATTPASPTTTPEVSATTPPQNPAPEDVVTQSVTLLAEQLGVEPTTIEVTRAIEVEWRNGSIGCAKKGMGYTDAIVPGSLVELTVSGETYAFHQGQGQPPFYCKNPTEPLDEQ
jgi:hypothetical protein